MNRPFKDYTIKYLSDIRDIIRTKICTNKDNDILDLDHQEFFANIYVILDEEIETQKQENIIENKIKL